ncbi:MAG TPA: grasp-with-spasm system SPASM domain peptide maturase [Pyrinomonadaceae bacterium]
MTPATEVFKLFANCLPVKGARRSTICDLQKQRMRLIPNDLFYILTDLAGLPTTEIKRRFNGDCDEVIDDYFTMLTEEAYGFWCDEPELFPKLDLSWDRPEKITNAIIDVDRSSKHDYQSLLSQLDELGCQALQIRAYDELTLADLEEILTHCELHRLRHLDLVIKFHPELTGEALNALCLDHQVISGIIVHSSPQKSRLKVNPFSTVVDYHTFPVTPSSCGMISPRFFSLTLEHFTEALNFNSCLNRKIGIGADGEIKACPAMKQSVGNAGHNKLKAVVNDPQLVQIGSITKDQVAVCRDCEFRYVCTDCRAYTQDANDLYSKPAKCTYDPYTATWAS